MSKKEVLTDVHPESLDFDISKLHTGVDTDTFLSVDGEDPETTEERIHANKTYNSVIQGSNLLAKAHAYIRYRVLSMSRLELAAALDISASSVGKIEGATSAEKSRLQYHYLNLFFALLRSKLPEENRPLIRIMIDDLLGENRDSIFGIFQEAEYRLKQNGIGENRSSLSFLHSDPKAIIAYERLHNVFERNHLGDIGMDRARADEIWRQEAMQTYTKVRKVPTTLAKLHVEDEISGLRHLTRKGTSAIKSTRRSATYRLARFQMPPIDGVLQLLQNEITQQEMATFLKQNPDAEQIAQIVRQCIPEEEWVDFCKTYQTECLNEESPPLFWKQILAVKKRNGINDQMIKRMLGVSSNLRPSYFLMDPTIQGKDLPNVISPPAILAHIISDSEEEAQSLIELYRENRTRYRRRLGVANAGNPLRLDREQWGVSCGEIADLFHTDLRAAKHPVEDNSPIVKDLRLCHAWLGWGTPAQSARIINKWENGQTHLTCYWDESGTKYAKDEDGSVIYNQKEEVKVVDALRNITEYLGNEKMKKPLAVKEQYSKPTTVSNLIIRSNEIAGAQVSDEFQTLKTKLTGQIDTSVTHTDMVSRHALRRYADELETPSWQVVREILEVMEIEYTENAEIQEDWMRKLKLDWQRKYAIQLSGTRHISDDVVKRYPAIPIGAQKEGCTEREASRIPNYLLSPVRYQPLSRILYTIIAEHAVSCVKFAERTENSRFYKEEIPKKLNTVLNKSKNLLEDSEDFQADWGSSWHTITTILDAADTENSKPSLYILVKELFNHKQDMDAAIAAWREQVPPEERDELDLIGLLPKEVEKALAE